MSLAARAAISRSPMTLETGDSHVRSSGPFVGSTLSNDYWAVALGLRLGHGSGTNIEREEIGGQAHCALQAPEGPGRIRPTLFLDACAAGENDPRPKKVRCQRRRREYARGSVGLSLGCHALFRLGRRHPGCIRLA